MGFMSTLFGSKPKATVRKDSLLTNEQQTGLKGGLNYFNKMAPSDLYGFDMDYGGQINAGANDLQGLSLSALEQLSLNMADPSGTNQLARGQLDSFLRGEKTGESSFEDFFTKNVQDPALEQFNENVLPGIGRSYGGSNFFGSERGRADDQARQDLLTGLTRERAAGRYQERQLDIDTMLKAIGLGGEFDASQAGIGSQLLESSLAARGAEQGDFDRLYQDYLTQQKMREAQFSQFSGLLNRNAIENSIITSGGDSGILGGFLKGVSSGIGQGVGAKIAG